MDTFMDTWVSIKLLINGATDRIRTYDPLITNEMLYQLSYSSIEQEDYIISPGIVQGAVAHNVQQPPSFTTGSAGNRTGSYPASGPLAVCPAPGQR